MSTYPQPQEQPEEPLPEAPKKMGPTPAPRYAPAARERVAHDEVAVRWSPVFAGVLIALGISIVLYALGVAIGLTTAAPAPAGRASNILQGAAIWSGATWLIALFVGGFLAGRLGTYFGLRRGVLQGSLVWALYTLILLSVVSSGVAGVIGAASNTGLPNAAVTEGANVNVPQALTTAGTAAWIFFGALVVGWLVAVFGGWLGERALRTAVPQHAA